MILILMLAIISLNTAFIHADTLPSSVLLPSGSVAVNDDASSVVFNPAGLGVRKGINGYLVHTLSGKTGGDNALFLSTAGIGFGAEFLDQAQTRFVKYTLSDGIKLFDGVYMGSGYSRFSSADDRYDKLSSWDIGLLCRPSRNVSLGLVARNLSRPRFNGVRTNRFYDVSLAIRPYTDRLTFSISSKLEEDKRIKDADISYAIDTEPINGILLRGSYNSDKSFDIKVGIGFPKSEFGSYRCYDSDRKHSGGAFYTRFSSEVYRSILNLERSVLEVTPRDVDLVEKAKNDKTIEGILIKPSLGSYGFGTIQEMRDAIMDFRSSDKKALCYMEMGGNKEYYLATSCDKIVINKSGYLSFNGLRSEVASYKGFLDNLGIEADFYRIGKYKSATEMFTDETMSEAYKESLNSILDDLNDQMVQGIADGRGKKYSEVLEWIDNGPYTPSEAEKSGLVDDLIYVDQLEMASSLLIEKRVSTLSSKEYARRRHYKYDWGTNSKIAVIYASGLMVTGESAFEWVMGSDTISEAIKEARKDDSIKAIVLRIDSGGGSVFASDLIWREVSLTKNKPLIVSMGDSAASGGYYIACPANSIFAEPGTVTGSIGVISGKLNLRGLYDKIGIKKEILKRGRNSDIYTLYSGFNDEQKEIVNRHIQETYQDFVSKVAKGRNMKEEEVELIAQGRIWTGRQAKEKGLVDELGGLQKAISFAKEKANLKGVTDVVIYPKSSALWRQLLSDRAFMESFQNLIKPLDSLARDRFLFITPFYFDFE